MSANPGNKLSTWKPSAPERGAFPLDHDGDCTEYMTQYLQCMKLVRNENAHNCRMLAKSYLKCRMDHDLMDRVDDWKELGLPNDKDDLKKLEQKEKK